MLSRLVSFSYDMPQMREQCSAEAVSQRRAPVHAVDVCRFVKTAQSKSQQSCNKKKVRARLKAASQKAPFQFSSFQPTAGHPWSMQEARQIKPFGPAKSTRLCCVLLYYCSAEP